MQYETNPSTNPAAEDEGQQEEPRNLRDDAVSSVAVSSAATSRRLRQRPGL
jgi:hypothetical protein